MTELQSKTITWLKTVLVMMVLFIHVHPDHNPGYHSVHDLAGAGFLWGAFSVGTAVMNTICNIAVPLFFFISGCLFFTGFDGWSWPICRKKMLKRVRTLLIPYLILNAVCFLYPPTANPDRLPVIGFLWDSVSYCQGWENWAGFDMQLYYPNNVPLWFVRDLMVMVLLSPALYWLVRRGGVVWLTISALAYWTGFLACAPGFSSNALFFFSLGAFFSIRKMDVVDFSRKHLKWTFPLSLVLIAIAVIIETPGEAQPFQNMYHTFGMPALFCLGAWAVEKDRLKIPALLGASGFFIYSTHIIQFGNHSLLSVTGDLGGAVFNLDNPWAAFVAYPCEIAFIVAVSVLVYFILSKSVPKLLALITGGR